MKVLGIETSCDETAIAVVEDGRSVLSNVIASQVSIHARYGGVVPEVAARQHMLEIVGVLNEALSRANISLSNLDAVSVTNGPGLAGALLVGVNFAKALAFSLDVPMVAVNHLEGHIYASWVMGIKPENEPGFPLLCLIASGGHTDLIVMTGHGSFSLLGRTRDDAAGEAFDKAARVLGLGYPGGPEVQRVARGALGLEKLPRAWMPNTLDFSFSGLKTALLHRALRENLKPSPWVDTKSLSTSVITELAAAFQSSVVDVLVTKAVRAALEIGAKGILLGGGVAANTLLRETMVESSPLPVLVPPPVLCTDNGAMIASCGYFLLRDGVNSDAKTDVIPSLRLG